jgi:hypothetical protein
MQILIKAIKFTHSQKKENNKLHNSYDTKDTLLQHQNSNQDTNQAITHLVNINRTSSITWLKADFHFKMLILITEQIIIQLAQQIYFQNILHNTICGFRRLLICHRVWIPGWPSAKTEICLTKVTSWNHYFWKTASFLGCLWTAPPD